MPFFFIDPPQTVYLILGAAVVIAGAIAAQRQDRRSAQRFLIALGVALVVFLLDQFLDSPREAAVRNTQAIVAAADAKNPDEFVKYVADTVTIHTSNGQSKPLSRDELKQHPFWHTLTTFEVHVAAWDYSRDDVKAIDKNTIEIGFMAKGESQGKQMPIYIRATFAKQPDGEFRLSELRTFEPVNRSAPLAIPGLP